MANRLQVLKYYLYYKYRKPFKNREQLTQWQQQKIKRHLAYVADRSPVYRGYRKLEDYPVINKNYMMEHFDDLNTAGIKRNRAEDFAVMAERERAFSEKLDGVTVGLSSGTSGSRGIFLVSDEEKDRWAGYVLARYLPGSILGNYSIAFFMRADSNLYQAVKTKNIQFHFFDILKPVAQHTDRLQAVNPQILAGQPSLLLMLAAELEKGTIDIRPNVVISIAEVLESEDEKRICLAFNIPILHQAYQCTEGFLASTCRYGTLHLNEDIVYVEKEDLGNDRFVPVITDFVRRTQPIIRYRLNDILVERKGGCRCNSPFTALDKIEGREDDVFIFSALNGTIVKVFPDFIRRCLLFAGCSTDYRVVQNKDNTITIYTDSSAAVRDDIITEFTKLADELGFTLPAIAFLPYVLEGGRKMKRVERKGSNRNETTKC